MESMKATRMVQEGAQQGKDPYLDNLREQIGSGFTSEALKKGNKKRNEMGKDDFLKLMTAQMRNQDPINPLKNEQMAAQLAQFSSLEQMMNVNQNLEKMMINQKPQDNVLAASLIGKNVVTESGRFNYDKGTEQILKFDLPKDAQKISISIVDNKGEIIREMELGAMKSGKQAIRWDGKANNGSEREKGEYSFRVNAVDQNSTPIQVKMSTAGLVTGVLFESGKPMLMIGDTKVPFDSVERIENPVATTSAADAAKESAKVLAKNSENLDDSEEKNVKASTVEESTGNKTKNIQNDQLHSKLGSAKIEEEGDSSFEGGGEEGGIPFMKGMDLWSPEN